MGAPEDSNVVSSTYYKNTICTQIKNQLNKRINTRSDAQDSTDPIKVHYVLIRCACHSRTGLSMGTANIGFHQKSNRVRY